jgi:CheY-like chemotaxis protein
MEAAQKYVLYVEDDIDDRELLSQSFQKVAPGLQLQYADNGVKALEILNNHRSKGTAPALIVLDLNMPYLDGVETFRHLQSDPVFKVIPLVVFSAGESPSDKSIFGEAGIPYFSKPTRMSSLDSIANQMHLLCAGYA